MQDQVPTATLPPFASAERVDLVFVLDGRTLVHPLPAAGRVLIGRSVPEGVTVAHASLSRSHAAITTPALTVEDLGSTNGTWLRRTDPDGTVHETAVREPVTLRPGDTLRLGAVSLVLVPSFVGGHTTSPAGDGSPSLDPAMREVHALLARVAPSDIPVLILGETGVGKEVLAERLHAASRRHAKPLLRVNCAALSEQLVESELFGHERGAFTGAVTAKPGLLEAAHGGTVLLDEIGDLRLESQAKLLRVLEEAKVLRVGGVTARARGRALRRRDPQRPPRRRAGRALSAATCTTASRAWCCACRPCASAPRSGSRWPRRSCARRASARDGPSRCSPTTRGAPRRTRGPATSASCGTASSARACCATAT
jgi:two-component system response regulator AtoC